MRNGEKPSSGLHEERVIEALHRVSGFTSEVTDLNRLLTIIMTESETLANSEASACMLYDEATDELYFEVALGEKAEGVKQIRLKRGTGIAWKCLEERQAILANDVHTDKRHYAEADHKSQFITRNMVATPMVFRGQIIGVLEVLNKRNEADYDAQDARILGIVADQAAMAIANARLVERSIQRERLAAIGLAVSGIAHHLKNIILSVKAPLGLIRLAFRNNDMKIIAESLPIMERGSARMEQSVKEMLDYSKDRKPELEPGNLKDILTEIADGCRARAEAAGVAMRTSLAEEIQDSYLDKLRLHDAVLNIVGNAIEAHGRYPKEAWVEVRARVSKNGRNHVIEIQDNAGGVPDEVRARIFQPFFSTKGSKGTGLGLAVAQKVAEENKGSLACDSAPGEGTTFTFVLPIVAEAPVEGREEEEEPEEVQAR